MSKVTKTRKVKSTDVSPSQFAQDVQDAITTGERQGVNPDEMHQKLLDIVNQYFPATDDALVPAGDLDDDGGDILG